MSEQKKFKTLTLILNMMFIISACGGTSSDTESQIATSVAQTVQAQSSVTETPLPSTLTPAPGLEATFTPQPVSAESTITNTPAGVTNPGCVASADLLGETPPDNTLYKPGDYFWKTWSFVNTGSCIWDKSYSLVFWSGDLMGGLVSYAIPEEVAPQGTVNISIYLQAPATEGTVTGYWRFKTPWGADFGVGPQSSSFYVQIGVSAKPKYGITNVEYTIVRDPAVGCPVVVIYTVYATVTANGPVEYSYYWDQSDGNESKEKHEEFKDSGTMTFKREWSIHKEDNPNPRWIQFVLTGSQEHDYGKAVIDNECLHPQ